MMMWKPTDLYPKAHQNRVHGRDPSLLGPRRNLIRAATKNFILLQLLFTCLFAYIFGALYQQTAHTHNMNVLFVDYDGGVIGESVRSAYAGMKGNSFPTLLERSPALFPTPGDLREEICQTRHWAALYTSEGASERLATALASTSSELKTYKRSDVLSYVWSEVLYSAVVDSTISANLQLLSQAARTEYVAINGTAAISLLSAGNSSNVAIFANPWTLTSVNIMPTAQGSRLVYNTLVIILILIQEFFYLGTINGLYAAMKIHNRIYPHRIIAYRAAISLAYTLIGSLCVTGMVWAFRAGWGVNAAQFFLTWMILWLFAHANFLSFDVFTIWLPPPYQPMALITWVIFNVVSILVPFELSNGFYRWAYAMPAHEVYQILGDIWSRGCNPKLHYALPILFAYELSGLLLTALGVYRRCHYAVVAQEAEEKSFQDRVDAALAFERKRDAEREQSRKENGGGPQSGDDEQRRDSTEMAEEIRAQDADVSNRRTISNTCGFGPSFDLGFGRSEPQKDG